MKATCKGEYQHQGIVKTERPHVVGAVQGTLAFAEVFVGLKETAVGAIDVFDDVLITAIVHLVNDGVSVSCIKVPYPFTTFFRKRFQRVVNSQLEEDVIGIDLGSERLKRRQ